VTRILVIEDDPTIRNLIAFTLADEGYEVDEASDGREALDLAARQQPDVIVLDMKMPWMDGWEFAKVYRDRHDSPAPILVLTAAQDADRRGEEINAEHIVSKPFDLHVLLERIAAISGKESGPQRPGSISA
jgi:two-component system, OmpR family, response regulator ResD